MSADIVCAIPESNMAQCLGPELGQTEPDSTQAVPWTRVSSMLSIMDDNSY